MNISNALAKMTPRQKQIGTIAIAIAALGLALYISLGGNKDIREERYNKQTDKNVNVITNANNKNMGVDALAGRIKYLDRVNHQLKQQLDRLERERDAEKRNDTQERIWKERFDALTAEIDKLRISQQDALANLPKQTESSGDGDKDAPKVDSSTVDDPFELRERKRRLMGGDDDMPSKRSVRGKARSGPLSINVIGEDEDEEEKEKAKEKAAKADTAKRGKKKKDSDVYIPAGSILTGTLINGADFPTGKGSYENPTPNLIRISKHAILPNRYTSDVRECFLLVGGRGELASERAKLRGEMLSCVRNDGSVIQTKLNSYVVGEDGKEGLKGRLVSKQGQLIARTMVAGFLSGMSEAFDYSPVSVLSTSNTGEVQYQKNFSSEAAQGGFAKGAKSALDKVADFYMQLADEMVPVIEINAGRQVDIIVISGTTLTAS